ncbi:hypothetical protein KSC_082370 [Ktedonobacter sp. SOSP1-52]|nr:hypothetical protein KSC_082370 [Ktedonobacter sp. SOSP1-52]
MGKEGHRTYTPNTWDRQPGTNALGTGCGRFVYDPDKGLGLYKPITLRDPLSLHGHLSNTQ